jgi:hypothetical protein
MIMSHPRLLQSAPCKFCRDNAASLDWRRYSQHAPSWGSERCFGALCSSTLQKSYSPRNARHRVSDPTPAEPQLDIYGCNSSLTRRKMKSMRHRSRVRFFFRPHHHRTPAAFPSDLYGTETPAITSSRAPTTFTILKASSSTKRRDQNGNTEARCRCFPKPIGNGI